MVDVELTNLLNLEERLRVVRLIEHDTGAYFNEISCSLGYEEKDDLSKKRLKAIARHLRHTEGVVGVLTQGDNITLASNQSWNLYRNCDQEMFINDLKNLFPGNLPPYNKGFRDTDPGKLQTIGLSFYPDFLSHEPIMHSVIFNLVKNGLKVAKDRRVLMNIRRLDKFPERALYVPEGARDYEQFVVFDLINSGGFSSKKPFIECLTSVPKFNEHGFGLYFVGLASRVLRAPVSITTDEKQTQISFYHPVYCKR